MSNPAFPQTHHLHTSRACTNSPVTHIPRSRDFTSYTHPTSLRIYHLSTSSPVQIHHPHKSRTLTNVPPTRIYQPHTPRVIAVSCLRCLSAPRTPAGRRAACRVHPVTYCLKTIFKRNKPPPTPSRRKSYGGDTYSDRRKSYLLLQLWVFAILKCRPIIPSVLKYPSM